LVIALPQCHAAGYSSRPVLEFNFGGVLLANGDIPTSLAFTIHPGDYPIPIKYIRVGHPFPSGGLIDAHCPAALGIGGLLKINQANYFKQWLRQCRNLPDHP